MKKSKTKASKKAHRVLEFELAGPASPARVARAATAIADLLRAASPKLSDEQVTLIVRNRHLRGELRTWGRQGEAAVEDAIKYLEKPAQTIKRRTDGARVAQRMQKPLQALAEEKTLLKRVSTKHVIRRVDLDFVTQFTALAEASPTTQTLSTVSGEDTLVGVILRVGRRANGAPILARIAIRADVIEMLVPPDLAAPFFDAAKSGGSFLITFGVTWRRMPDGGMSAAMDTAKARGIAPSGRGAIGLDLIESFQRAAPEAFADLEETMTRIRGD